MSAGSPESKSAVRKLGFFETIRKILIKDGIGYVCFNVRIISCTAHHVNSAFWRGVGPALVLPCYSTPFSSNSKMLWYHVVQVDCMLLVPLRLQLQCSLIGTFSCLVQFQNSVRLCSVTGKPLTPIVVFKVATGATYPYM